MNYTTVGNCPYCDANILDGVSSGWAGSDEMFRSLKEKHDMGHPENQLPQTGALAQICPQCGFLLTNQRSTK